MFLSDRHGICASSNFCQPRGLCMAKLGYHITKTWESLYATQNLASAEAKCKWLVNVVDDRQIPLTKVQYSDTKSTFKVCTQLQKFPTVISIRPSQHLSFPSHFSLLRSCGTALWIPKDKELMQSRPFCDTTSDNFRDQETVLNVQHFRAIFIIYVGILFPFNYNTVLCLVRPMMRLIFPLGWLVQQATHACNPG